MGRRKPGKVLAPPAERTADGDKKTQRFDLSTPQYPLPDHAELPDGAEIQEDGAVLFKQTGDLFKQVYGTNGAVIGLIYLGPRMASPSTMSQAQVRSRKSIYERRAEVDATEAVLRSLEIWTWALGLFGTTQSVTTEQIQTIHQEEEAPC